MGVYEWRKKWWCEFKAHPKLGRVRESFKTEAEARALDAHITAYGAYPGAFDKEPGVDYSRTWAACRASLETHGGPDGQWRSKPQDRTQKSIMNTVEDSKLGRTPVQKITKLVLQEYVKELAKKRGRAIGSLMSAKTINHYLIAIGIVLNHGEDLGWIERTPKLPYQKGQEWHQPIYSETQLQGVCGVLREWGHPVDAFLCELLYHSAMRAGELLKLTPAEIDGEYILMLDPRKIKNRNTKIVHIGKPAADKLRAIIAGNQLPKYNAFYKRLRRAVEKCGYDIPRPIHAFRHTAASSIAGEVGDLQEAADLLGNSLQTTAKYRKLSPDLLRERAKSLSHRRGKINVDDATSSLIPFKKSGS